MEAAEVIALAAVIASPVTAAITAILTNRGQQALEHEQMIKERDTQLYLDISEFAMRFKAAIPALIEITPPADHRYDLTDLWPQAANVGGRIAVLKPGQLDEEWSGIYNALISLNPDDNGRFRLRGCVPPDHTERQWLEQTHHAIGRILDITRMMVGEQDRRGAIERWKWRRTWRHYPR